MRVAYLANTGTLTKSPTAMHRCVCPADWLNAAGHIAIVYDENDYTRTDFGANVRADIVVIHRLRKWNPAMLERIKMANPGVKFILDMDDNLFDLWDGAYVHYFMNDYERTWTALQGYIDAITVSCEALKRVIAERTHKPIYVIENGYDFNAPIHRNRLHRQRVEDYARDWNNKVVYYGGHSSHFRDIEMFMRTGIIEEFGSVHTAASLPGMQWVFAMNVTEVVPRSVNGEFVRFVGYKPFDDFIADYILPSTLVIAPLVTEVLYRDETGKIASRPEPVNTTRSALKCIEAGAAMLPIVCSEIDSYKPFPGAKIVPNTKDAWGDAMADLLTNPELSARMGRLNREYTEETHNAERLTAERLRIFQTVRDN